MTSLAIILASFWALGGTTVTEGDYIYTDLSLDEKVFTGNLMFESPAISAVDCARLCSVQDSCVTFTFNQNTCRGHSVLMTSSAESSPSPGTFTYARNRELKCEKDGVTRLTDASLGLDTNVDCEDDWLVFQRRQDGSVDFYRNWAEYVNGFGDVHGEYWLGLEALHLITTSGVSYELRVDLMMWNGTTGSASYSDFTVGPAADNYRLHYGSFLGGTAGDSMSCANGMQFSTLDRDHDGDHGYNLAVEWHGAWWYNEIFGANLNGDYKTDGSIDPIDSVEWYSFMPFYSLKSCKMMIRSA